METTAGVAETEIHRLFLEQRRQAAMERLATLADLAGSDELDPWWGADPFAGIPQPAAAF